MLSFNSPSNCHVSDLRISRMFLKLNVQQLCYSPSCPCGLGCGRSSPTRSKCVLRMSSSRGCPLIVFSYYLLQERVGLRKREVAQCQASSCIRNWSGTLRDLDQHLFNESGKRMLIKWIKLFYFESADQ